MSSILVIDDDIQVLNSIKRVLERTGYEVHALQSGQEGLDHLQRQRPDLIILDIIMPEMDGLEVCSRIRANPFLARIPIIFLTAKSRPTDIVGGLDQALTITSQNLLRSLSFQPGCVPCCGDLKAEHLIPTQIPFL